MITLRAFTKDDYMGFAGAERASDGTEPHISTSRVTLNGYDALVVVDAESIHVYYADGPGDNTWFQFVMKNIHAAIAFAGALPAELDTAFLVKHGFSHL